VAWRCARLAGGKAVPMPDREAIFWWMLSAALLALGIFKLLDLQTALAAMGRSIANQHGWYSRRRPVQLAIIAAVLAAGAAGAAISLWLARSTPPPTRSAVIGVLALVAFVAVRTISFHGIDLFLESGYAGLKLNWFVEVGGILVVFASARWRLAYRDIGKS
jgi:hypothetical protein